MFNVNSSCHLEKATQHDIQLVLDTDLQCSLLISSNIRDQARLKSIAARHVGSRLRAIPNSNVGLVMSHMSLLYLCTIGSFMSVPSAVRYPCGTIIDEYGNHTFCFGPGPLRIKHHDAMCCSTL